MKNKRTNRELKITSTAPSSAFLRAPSSLLLALGALLFAFCVSVEAQQPTKVPRIGYLDTTSPVAASARIGVFRQALREFGYVEGKNIVVEYRWAEGKIERVPNLAAELVHLKVDVIVTGGPQSTRAAKNATLTIPIVMAFDDDPVGNGFVASLARPGGNITGLSTLAPEISGKRLELLKEIVPKLSHVAVLGASTEPDYTQVVRETELAARALGVQLQYLNVLGPKDIATAFRDAIKGRADAVLMNVTGSILIPQRKEITALAVKSRLPAIYGRAEHAEAG